jgi:hypothetical protein
MIAFAFAVAAAGSYTVCSSGYDCHWAFTRLEGRIEVSSHVLGRWLQVGGNSHGYVSYGALLGAHGRVEHLRRFAVLRRHSPDDSR